MPFVKPCCSLVLLLLLTSCGAVTDDLAPSGADKRPSVQTGTSGPAVGQSAPDFTLPDTLGHSVTLSSELTISTLRGAVLYFTMWCPICDSHMSHMLSATIPRFPTVRFFAVDYVSGAVTDARNAEVADGFADSAFTVLADVHQTVLGSFQATMGTTVVIDKAGIIRMSEDYKDGSRLEAVLEGLP
jgi:peroxiredoxin